MQSSDQEDSSFRQDMPTDLSFISNNENATESMVNTKATFSSMWNNMKYEIQSKFRTKFNFDSPICLLGKFYHIKMSDSINYSDKKKCTLYMYEKFKHDFYSRIWLTYRRDFPPLLETTITSDSGWGCMIRSGQMILAQALSLHLLGRNWRWKGAENEDGFHRMIVTWFLDNSDTSFSPFSIHQFVKLGQKQDRKPGDWFGPSSISFIIQSALERGAQENEFLKDICCYVGHDCTVFLQDVIDMCTVSLPSDSRSSWRSCLILVPARLGGERFNPLYSSYVKEILSLPYSIGVIGGKPRHSLYFVGFQEEKLVYMDPHYCQRAIDVMNERDFSLDSFHCQTPRKVSLHSMDPSCAFGFYIKSRHELDEFVEHIEQLQERTLQAGDYPIFSLNPGKNEPHEPDEEKPEKVLRMKYRLVDSKGNVQKVINTEEFVLL